MIIWWMLARRAASSRPPDGELRGRLRATEPRWGGGAAVIAANPATCQKGALTANGTVPAGAIGVRWAEKQSAGWASASRGIIPEGCATGRRARQDTEHDHGATAGRAAIGPMRRDGILDLFGGRFLRWRVEQLATERKLGGALAVREEAVVADAMEAVRQGVQQEAPDALIGRKSHELGLAVMAIKESRASLS